jgi:2,4-dienoyl-CoA reductase-like NADH-dependent reductase (Old Yellow Enzyme family)
MRIGNLNLPNRFIRSATYETMATDRGEVTAELLDLYDRLASGGIGLIFTGHTYVHPRGQAGDRQLGIYDDFLIPGLRRLVDMTRRHKGRIFVQLAHAGSQIKPSVKVTPLGPSRIPNPITGRVPQEATEAEIQEVIDAFGEAAQRAKKAGFDGIHIHAANGYLISQFNSPFSNRRIDNWGGDAQRRWRFVQKVYLAVRNAVGPDIPITMKLGIADAIQGGLQEPEGVSQAAQLEKLGLDALEVSCGVMAESYGAFSCRQYVGVNRQQAFRDHLYHRLFSKPVPEAYFLPYARAIKQKLQIPVILVGGLRSAMRMVQILADGYADFVAMSRPFVREPDLVQLIQKGQKKITACTSCNLCLLHSGLDPLRCWRQSWRDLFNHIWSYYVRDFISRQK